MILVHLNVLQKLLVLRNLKLQYIIKDVAIFTSVRWPSYFLTFFDMYTTFGVI